MTPVRYGRELAAKIEGCQTTIVKGSAHSLMTERPDEVLDALITIV
jgi:pimeloyl-ACP methyl ester carboxylesterase